jgi:hypothetical protein
MMLGKGWRYGLVYAVLLVGGSVVLFFAANWLEPGPVISLLVGMTWALVAHLGALALAVKLEDC